MAYKSNLQYRDFAEDELKYFVQAYNSGMRYNAMVAQAQRICECYLKQVISNNLLTNNDVMMQHNLRTLYEYATNELHLAMQNLHQPIMTLNNFYTHTRYPGREAFMATEQDIDSAFNAIKVFIKEIQRFL